MTYFWFSERLPNRHDAGAKDALGEHWPDEVLDIRREPEGNCVGRGEDRERIGEAYTQMLFVNIPTWTKR
jgi:hypothetical protein